MRLTVTEKVEMINRERDTRRVTRDGLYFPNDMERTLDRPRITRRRAEQQREISSGRECADCAQITERSAERR